MSYGYQRLRNRPGQSTTAVFGLREVSDLEVEAIVNRMSRTDHYGVVPDSEDGQTDSDSESSMEDVNLRTGGVSDTVFPNANVVDSAKAKAGDEASNKAKLPNANVVDNTQDKAGDKANAEAKLPLTTAHKLGILLAMKSTAQTVQEHSQMHQRMRSQSMRRQRPATRTTTDQSRDPSKYKSTRTNLNVSPVGTCANPVTSQNSQNHDINMRTVSRLQMHQRMRSHAMHRHRPATWTTTDQSRAPSGCATKYNSTCTTSNVSPVGTCANPATSQTSQNHASEPQINMRTVRRLQKWTEALRHAVTRRSYDKIAWQQEKQQQLRRPCLQRSYTDYIRCTGKTVPTISRSTRSALARTRDSSGDIQVMIKTDIERSRSSAGRSTQKVVPVVDVESVVNRVTTPTLATLGNQANCIKASRGSLINQVGIRKHLPLISGLERSADVTEITNRLYSCIGKSK